MEKVNSDRHRNQGEKGRARTRIPERLLRALLFGLVVVAFFGTMRYLAAAGMLFPFQCPFHRLIGLPCPFCGGTRAMVLLASGKVAEAVAYNPLAALAVLGLLLLGMYALLPRRIRAQFPSKPVQGPQVRRLAVAAVLMNWLYLIVSGR